ncbi:glycosyltransferase family 4 protein [Desulfobulbus rhabdoformis]|uniref:glycosyltransferase family 4 protein n=1 Tax=Desulfobulbus rhabdoformis TaxID=34032 RepID=UPI0019655CAC|nr:glycosyltransferase family 4 protein [Desulfobulbus rhabdoformis]MBM9613251.1 glycosyltransferase family 4 protein [Desulfobulbus rhabdoformis]
MEKKITVAQILPDLYEGGVERGTVDLSKYLVEHDVNALVISGGGPMVSQLEAIGCRHLKLNVGEKKPATLFSIRKLQEIILAEKIDIIHARSRVPAWVAYLALKLMKKTQRPKFITTFHGFYSVNKYSEIMTKGEVVIAVSHVIRKHIEENYKISSGKIQVISRGLDTSIFSKNNVAIDRQQQLLQRWNLPQDDIPLIMIPGRVSSWKGQDVFIKCLALIKKLPWKAVVVGGYEKGSRYTERLHALVRESGLEQRVHFVGTCTDMPAAYNLASVIVSASSGQPEAFGRIAIEAQAMEVPIIATAHGGSLETVLDENSGYLVKPGDHEDMAGKIQLVLEDANRATRMGIKGRDNVMRNFSLERMCSQTVDVYKKILS